MTASLSTMQLLELRSQLERLPLRGLTVRQPWASAIVHGPKRIENRDWKPTRKTVPVPGWFAIHAGDVEAWWRRAMSSGASNAMARQIRRLWPAALIAEFPRGAVIGLARLELTGAPGEVLAGVPRSVTMSTGP